MVALFLCGDVMTGRGVDQILAHPGDPRLWELYVNDAREYVRLAEAANGPIPRPVPFSWPWGEALTALDEFAPDVRVINLETSITTSGDVFASKAVNYRMNPENLACLTAAKPDVCALANNHVLDFGHTGLQETLDVLAGAGILTAGAGRDLSEARRPAIVPVVKGGRVIVFSLGSVSSGIPLSWAATELQPGVDLLPNLSAALAAGFAERVRRARQPGDIVLASIHWGSNWGYEVVGEQVDFAHRLIDAGVDLVHGHSSHHARPIEIYRGRLILYGCGDFIDDYEGIKGHGGYRDELRLLYFPALDRGSGRLDVLRIVPMRARQMSLHRATAEESRWLYGLLSEISRPFGADVTLASDGTLTCTERGS